MIKILNGIHETVDYNLFSSIKIYLNREAEDYPLHWHPAAEIIMPLKNNYTVVINDISYTLDEGDIFIIPPGTLHHLISPPPPPRWGASDHSVRLRIDLQHQRH